MSRRIVMFNRVSGDGYFAGRDGNLDWVIPEEEIDKAVAEQIEKEQSPGPDTILFGRKTYEMFESFWPHAVDDSPTTRAPHGPERRTEELKAMGVFINEAVKLVFSKSLKSVTWKNSRLLRELDSREIEALKREPGKDMLIFGSGSIVSQLTEHGLIDEYRFVVSPLFLGDGRTLISGVPKRLKLKLLEAKGYPSGNVMLRYSPAA
jgi:dihydrofolate reductase